MWQALFIIFQILALYWLSAAIYDRLGILLFFHLKGSQPRMILVLNLIFLPGVLLHELAHLLVGRILWVKTGRLTVMPVLLKDGSVRMGSVAVPRTDIFRHFFISVAPFVVGLSVIFGIIWTAENWQLWQWWAWWLIIGYILFEVANTMFLSPSDIRGAAYLVLAVSLIVALSVGLGWRPDGQWIESMLAANNELLAQVVRWLWLPIVVDVAALFVLWLLAVRMRRTVRRRLDKLVNKSV
jgi:hypothetical protein